MAKINWKSSMWLAGLVALVVWVVAYLMNTVFKTTVQPLFSSYVTPTSGVTTTIGSKAIEFISGYGFNLPASIGSFSGFISLYVSALAIVLVGMMAVMYLPSFRGFMGYGAREGKIASALMYGAVLFYLVFMGFKLPAMATLFGLILHTLVVAWLVVFAANMLRIQID